MRVSEDKGGSSRLGFLRRAAPTVHYEDMQARLQGWGLTILRVATGIVFLVSGGHKLFGGGFNTVAEDLGEVSIPFPLLAATTASLVEFLCGAALLLGLFTRWVSIPLAIVMVVDMLLFHPPSGGFFLEYNKPPA